MRRSCIAAALFFAIPVLVASSISASPAYAQSEDRALALDLFEQGRALVTRSDYAAALPKFEAAAKLMRTFGVLLNLAECQEKLGRTASAWATWSEARAVAADAHKSSDEAMAAERQKALEPRLTRLTIVVPQAADLPDLEIRRDGIVIPRGAWGTGIPVDPGMHIVEERAAGRKPKTVSVTVEPNAPSVLATMTVLEAEAPTSASAPGLAPPPIASGPPLAVPPPRHESEGTGSAQRLAGWILGGAGIAATGVGIAVAVAGQNQHNDAVAAQVAGNTSSAQSEESSANTTKIAGYATIGAGAAFLVGGVVLLLTAPSTHKSNASAFSLSPWISKTGAGSGFSKEW